jgi:hypothetical protein
MIDIAQVVPIWENLPVVLLQNAWKASCIIPDSTGMSLLEMDLKQG